MVPHIFNAIEGVIRDGENRNKFWSYIKSKGQEFSGVAPLKNKAGFIQSDNLSKANILNDQFHSVYWYLVWACSLVRMLVF
jgi:hypothetical protein